MRCSDYAPASWISSEAVSVTQFSVRSLPVFCGRIYHRKSPTRSWCWIHRPPHLLDIPWYRSHKNRKNYIHHKGMYGPCSWDFLDAFCMVKTCNQQKTKVNPSPLRFRALASRPRFQPAASWPSRMWHRVGMAQWGGSTKWTTFLFVLNFLTFQFFW